jgi:putative SOS response-associated peptidase YedK
MCGRYALTHTELIPGFFEVEDLRIPPRFNIAPTQFAPVVFLDSELQKRIVDFMKWGLVPSWSKDVSIGSRMINARAETVASKPSFRGPFRYRRCLVPASGFFEWKQTQGGKQPFYFFHAENPLLGLAGVWDEYTDGDTLLYTYSIITRPATAQMSRYHQRMPVAIEPGDFDEWLSAETSVKGALGLLEAEPEKNLDVYPVSTIVNNVRNDSPENLKQLAIDD